jgi:hypothetical protein
MSPLHIRRPSSSSTWSADKHDATADDDDTRSMRSLDLEEAKAMLRDAPEHEALFEPRKRSRVTRCVAPCSLVLNALLFVAVLAILSHPCSFSSRKCVYEGHQLHLLGEEHGFVPECKFREFLSLFPFFWNLILLVVCSTC